jgi:hypothetical protein
VNRTVIASVVDVLTPPGLTATMMPVLGEMVPLGATLQT